MKNIISLALVAILSLVSINSSYAQENPKCKKECCKKCESSCKEKCSKEDCSKKCEDKKTCTKETAKA